MYSSYKNLKSVPSGLQEKLWCLPKSASAAVDTAGGTSFHIPVTANYQDAQAYLMALPPHFKTMQEWLWTQTKWVLSLSLGSIVRPLSLNWRHIIC